MNHCQLGNWDRNLLLFQLFHKLHLSNRGRSALTYSLHIFIAQEPSIKFRANKFEHTVQVVSRLAVGVLDLPKYLVIDKKNVIQK